MPVDIFGLVISGCLDMYIASPFMVTVDETLGFTIAIGAVPNLSRFVSRSQHAIKTDK